MRSARADRPAMSGVFEDQAGQVLAQEEGDISAIPYDTVAAAIQNDYVDVWLC